MLQDNTLIFAEAHADVAASSILELNGSTLARAFVFMTLPAGITAAAVTLKCAQAKTSDTVLTSPMEEVHNASDADLKRGVMAFPLPVNAYKFAQVAIDITGAPIADKDFVCGITDAPDNTEVFYES